LKKFSTEDTRNSDIPPVTHNVDIDPSSPAEAEPALDITASISPDADLKKKDVTDEDTGEQMDKKEPVSNNVRILEKLDSVLASVEHIAIGVKDISDSAAKTVIEIRDMHRLYHNEFACRLRNMQEEIERYREIDKGRIFDGVLGEIAKLYSDHESILDVIEDEKLKKRIRYIFSDIIQILEANRVSIQKSSPGDMRNTRYCRVAECIPTDDPALHDTVVKSHNTGFYVEKRSLINEMVDIYKYTDKPNIKSKEN
jgi:hypothetical protein